MSEEKVGVAQKNHAKVIIAIRHVSVGNSLMV